MPNRVFMVWEVVLRLLPRMSAQSSSALQSSCVPGGGVASPQTCQRMIGGPPLPCDVQDKAIWRSPGVADSPSGAGGATALARKWEPPGQEPAFPGFSKGLPSISERIITNELRSRSPELAVEGKPQVRGS